MLNSIIDEKGCPTEFAFRLLIVSVNRQLRSAVGTLHIHEFHIGPQPCLNNIRIIACFAICGGRDSPQSGEETSFSETSPLRFQPLKRNTASNTSRIPATVMALGISR